MEKPAPARRRQEDRSRETIDRLRAAALETIAERGYAATTTSEVARRAGVSRGALLHHFPKRVDLIADVAGHVWGEAAARLRRIAGEMGRAPEDVAGFVEAMWETVFRAEAARMTVDLVSAAHVDPELGDRIAAPLAALFEEYERIAAEAFARAGAGGAMGARQRLACVYVATCALRGLRMQEMMRPDPAMAAAVRETLAELLATHLDAGRAARPTLAEVGR